MDEINQKLTYLRNLYPDKESEETFTDIEKNARIAALTSKLRENDAMKLLIAQYQKEIATLEHILKTDQTLFDDEKGRFLGKLTHARIAWCKKFLNIFTKADADLLGKRQHLDNLINHENN